MIDSSWAPPTGIPAQKLLVLAYTNHFFGDHYGRSIPFQEGWGLNLECEFSSDVSRIDEADAIWFHGPSITQLPKKKEGQKWVIMSMESEENYPFLGDEKVMALFDIHMTYRLDSDVPVLYPNWPEYNGFITEASSLETKKSQMAPVLYAASNPVKVRDDYVKKLMNHIPVDSIGLCLNNRTIEGFSCGTGWSNDGFKSLLSVIRRYKFYIALENSRTHDYVTERIFMALSAGSVPIYLGAENVREFLPSDDAIICAGDFSTPAELAEYLRLLDQDDDAYLRHLAWKTNGYSESFERLVNVSSTSPLTRLFVKLAHNCGHECACGGRLRETRSW